MTTPRATAQAATSASTSASTWSRRGVVPAFVLASLAGLAPAACGSKTSPPPTAPFDGGVASDAGLDSPAPPDTAPPPDTGPVIPPQGDIPVEVLWTIQLGASTGGNRSVACLTADPAGNVFFAGRVVGSFDADPGPATAMMDAGAAGRTYLTKITSAGRHAFTTLFDANVPSDFGVTSLYCSAAADGSVHLAGMFRAFPNAPVDFDPGAAIDARDSGAAGSQHLWVVHMAADGSYLGVRTSTGPASVALAEIAIASDAALWLSGVFDGDPDFDPSALSAVLHAGRGTPAPRHTFLVRWAADGTTIARDPGDFLARKIAPTAGGDVILSGSAAAVGVYTGNAGLPNEIDLDYGLGLDLHSPVLSRTGYVRVRPDTSVAWSLGMDAGGAGGSAFAHLDGSGLIVGTYTGDHTDFDWGPRVDGHNLALNSTADIFVTGFLPGFEPSHLSTRAHSILSGYGAPEAHVMRLAYGEHDRRVYGVGFTGGAVVFPGGEVVGGTASNTQPFVFATAANGRFAWAAQLGYDSGLGGGGTPLLAVSQGGVVVLAGGFSGTADLDFTARGAQVREGKDGAYLTAFRALHCTAGETRPCACGYDEIPALLNACVDGHFAGCGCRSALPGFQAGERFPPAPPPSCDVCPAGFSCGSDWLCVPPTDPARAGGLDHPVEIVIAGADVYAVAQGPYVLPVIGVPHGSVVRLKGGAGPAEVVYTGSQPGHLATDGTSVWFSDGLKLLKVGTADTAAVVMDSSATSLFGAIAFDGNWRFVARSTPPPGNGYVVERTLRTAPVGPVSAVDTTVATAGLVAMLSDGTRLYALDGAQLLYVPLLTFDAAWVKTGRAQKTSGLATDNRYVYFVDAAIDNSVYRFEKATGLIDLLVGQILGALSAPVVADGSLYVAQAGWPAARTFAGNVFRVDLTSRSVTNLVPGLNHPAAIALGPQALWVALHGDTRETTTTGAIHQFVLQ